MFSESKSSVDARSKVSALRFDGEFRVEAMAIRLYEYCDLKKHTGMC